KRVLVALVAVPLLLAATFCPSPWVFKALVVAALLAALQEFFRMAPDQRVRPQAWVSHLCLLALLAPLFFPGLPFFSLREAVLLALALPCLAFLFSARPPQEMLPAVPFASFAALYFGLLGGYFLSLRDLPRGPWLLLFVYVATWAYDTGGYFAGRFLGRHKMTPQTSPQKTWEGALGGLVLALGALFLLWACCPAYREIFRAGDLAALGVLLSLFGQLGDLVESMVKRSLAAKDSGSFFPGHGGVFDRIDSLLFTAPVLFYYLTLRP
ncbi:MAG TPA: phosphatidate cytidylyltransferase, partial [bacterium]|nr:phosphatidate cytidylyltransferase [bacterium]